MSHAHVCTIDCQQSMHRLYVYACSADTQLFLLCGSGCMEPPARAHSPFTECHLRQHSSESLKHFYSLRLLTLLVMGHDHHCSCTDGEMHPWCYYVMVLGHYKFRYDMMTWYDNCIMYTRLTDNCKLFHNSIKSHPCSSAVILMSPNYQHLNPAQSKLFIDIVQLHSLEVAIELSCFWKQGRI